MEPQQSVSEMTPPDAQHAQANKLFQTGVMLMYGKRKSVDKCIKCIQRAITLDDLNYKYWQILGEAYYQRGSLNPAINCFSKSLNLAENLIKSDMNIDDADKKRIQADCIYSSLRMSDIRLSVLHLDDALQGYNDIIKCDPTNVAALVGIAKAELQTARRCFSNGLVKSGHTHCMNALKHALEATKLSPHLCHNWKLASDCCLIQFIYGQRGQFSTKLHMFNFPGCDQEGLVIDRLTCIELSQQFLCKALAVESFKESSCLWHNLGISLYLKSTLVTDQNDRTVILNRALKCLIKALDHDRLNSQIRNSIGIVSFHLDLLKSAQTFLVNSIQTNRSTSEIQFSNLGYIYLQKGEFRLASIAFKRCQAEEPLYCRSWLGNAMLNEQSNIDNLSFLRHCHKLENNYESQLMYATKVACLPDEKEYKKDLTNATDCMKRLINYNPNSIEAINTIGLLLERSNHKTDAINYTERAHRLALDDPRLIFNRLRLHQASALGCGMDRASSSGYLADFLGKAEKLSDGTNREYMLNFISYLLLNRDYSTINRRVTKIIEKLAADDIRGKLGAQILLAMTDKATGGDFKSWLFKNIIDSESIVCVEALINLLCLMLFSSITKDVQLLNQVAGDLNKYLSLFISSHKLQLVDILQSPDGYWLRLTLCSSIFCLDDRSRLLRPLVALFPTIAEFWLYLGLSCMFKRASNHTALYCIRTAHSIGSTNAELCVVCDILLAILADQKFIKSHMHTRGNRLVHLSRALFKYPQHKLLWDSLLSVKVNLDFGDKSKKQINTSNEFDIRLFQLAIDHIIKLIIA